MPAGYLISRDQAHDRLADALCPDCGHPCRSHLEHRPTKEMLAAAHADGRDPNQIRHPRHRPGLFACRVDGCDCEKGLMT